ncbi:uncharacterized protein LOC142982557 isoform X1 [Anticarsia gemmatalis]|uniref:uncharacterized protein LOC142982557 isoform X1 n=1 Tax=Anticarsia gemmatalis TaxID=129554 RepID=UPI003F765542
MLFVFLVFSFSFIVFDYSEADLVKPQQQCVPSATAHGPCYNCMCGSDGAFHCVHRECVAIDLSQQRTERDCQPYALYIHETTYCTCDGEGFWRSDNCQAQFSFLHARTIPIRQTLRTTVPCQPNSYYIVDCNICRCGAEGSIDPIACTNRRCVTGHKIDQCKAGDVLRTSKEICACSDINYYIDRLCLSVSNDAIQKVATKDLSKLVDMEKSWKNDQKTQSIGCDEELLYTLDCNSCVCKDGQFVCTSKVCHLTKKLALRMKQMKGDRNNLAFESLNEVTDVQFKCEPGKSYRYKCNTCHCTKEGTLSCGAMLCLDDYVLDEMALRAVLSTP